MSILNLGVLNSIKNGVNSLISGVGKGTNSQTLTLEPGVQTTTNVFDVSDVNAIIAIKLSAITNGGIECGIRYHDESGGISFVDEPVNFLAQSIYEQREIRLKASRVSFILTNNGAVNKTLTLTLSKTASELKSVSNEINVVSLFDASSVELAPLDNTVASKEFEFDSDYIRIGFYGLSGTFPANLELGARYTTPSGSTDYVLLDTPFVTEVKSGYNEGVVVRLKYRKVSFRFRNTSASSFTLSRIVASKVSGAGNISSPDEDLIPLSMPLLFEGNDSITLEPETQYISDVMTINGDFAQLGIYSSEAAMLNIGYRYHSPKDGAIFSYNPEFTTPLNKGYLNDFVMPNLHSRVSVRFINKSSEPITLSRLTITPRGSSGFSDTENKDTQLVKFDGSNDTFGYDAFYGSFKNLRTYKNDFMLVVMPETEKKNNDVENMQFSLQYGVEHLRIYLKITTTGNPFPLEGDGVSLNVKLADNLYKTTVLSGEKIKEGQRIYILGVNEPIDGGEVTPHLFGTEVHIEMAIEGTIDSSNFITYEIVTFQKFK